MHSTKALSAARRGMVVLAPVDGSGNQVDATPAAPVDVSGNQVTVIGDGNEAGDDPSDGDDHGEPETPGNGGPVDEGPGDGGDGREDDAGEVAGAGLLRPRSGMHLAS